MSPAGPTRRDDPAARPAAPGRSGLDRPVTHVEVVVRPERDVTEWARRHERGEVPGRWPYGLDLVARPGVTVSARPVAEPGRADVVRTRLRDLVPRRAAPGGAGRRIGLAWEENLARRMVHLAPQPETYAGTIWLTDTLARGGDGRAVLDVLRRTTGLFVLSSAQVEPLARALGRGAPPVSAVRFGIDERFFAPRPYPERPVVLSLGVDRDRDPATLFAALEAVLRVRPDVEAVVQTRSDRPPPPGVRVVPPVPHAELRDLYARAAVVVVPTRPNLHVSGMTVALEAMATARPVVLSATAGAADYVDDGVTGLLAPVGDAAGVADRVLALLADPAAAAAMGTRGRTAVEQRYTSARMVDALADVMGLGHPDGD